MGQGRTSSRPTRYPIVSYTKPLHVPHDTPLRSTRYPFVSRTILHCVTHDTPLRSTRSTTQGPQTARSSPTQTQATAHAGLIHHPSEASPSQIAPRSRVDGGAHFAAARGAGVRTAASCPQTLRPLPDDYIKPGSRYNTHDLNPT